MEALKDFFKGVGAGLSSWLKQAKLGYIQARDKAVAHMIERKKIKEKRNQERMLLEAEKQYQEFSKMLEKERIRRELELKKIEKVLEVKQSLLNKAIAIKNKLGSANNRVAKSFAKVADMNERNFSKDIKAGNEIKNYLSDRSKTEEALEKMIQEYSSTIADMKEAMQEVA